MIDFSRLLQETHEKELKARQALAIAQAQKPQRGLLDKTLEELPEGQEGPAAPNQTSITDLFTGKITDNQRSAMFDMGLNLMASDPTARLSQRVAVAIQQGVGTMQEGREADLAAERASAQAGVDAAERESDALMDRFELFKSGKELGYEEDRVRIAKEKEDRLAKGTFSDRFEATLSGDEEPSIVMYNPTANEGRGEYMRDGVILSKEQVNGMKLHDRVPSVNMVDKEGKSLGLSFDDGKTLADGTSVPEGALKMGKPTLTGSSDDIGVKLGQRADNKEVSENRDLAQGMEQNLHDIERMDELTSKLFTGPFGSGSIAKGISQIGAIGEEITGRDFGVQDVAADYEELATMTTEFGIRTLKLFGGNDTERELLTALRIQPSEDKLPKTNERLIKRKKAAFEVLSKKPEFQEKWRIENGGLDKADESGKTFSQAWRQFQRNTFSGLDEPEVEDEPPVETDDSLIDYWKSK